MVTTPEVSAIRDADRIVGLLEASEFRQIDLIINRLRYDMVKRGEMMSSQDVVDILALNLIGIVPDDENVVTDGSASPSAPAGPPFYLLSARKA